MIVKDYKATMGKDELIHLFSVAYSRMLKRDACLFDASKQVQERTFMHRFAFCLRELLVHEESYVNESSRPLLSLDVEYNREGDDIKRACRDDDEGWIGPDIIFHERGSGSAMYPHRDRNNIFVCEMKKNGKVGSTDYERVERFVQERKYSFGIDFHQFSVTPGKFTLCQSGFPPEEYVYNPGRKSFVKIGE